MPVFAKELERFGFRTTVVAGEGIRKENRERPARDRDSQGCRSGYLLHEVPQVARSGMGPHRGLPQVG